MQDENICCAIAVFGSDRPSALADDSARFRSFWCNLILKPGLNVPVEHAFGVHFQDAGRRKAPHHRLAHLGRIGPGLRGEHQCLRHRLDIQGDDDLVRDLADLAGAGFGPTWVMFLPISSNSGLARAKAASGPPTMIVSAAFFAPTSPPETGASR